MKRFVIAIPLLLIILLSAFLLMMRYRVVVAEGYPTWQAVRNMIFRDGEISIRLPDGMRIVSAKCDYTDSVVSTEGQVVNTKIGYSWSKITIEAEAGDIKQIFVFHPQKLNNWNRISYYPTDPSNPESEFIKIENGVRQQHNDLTRTKKKANKS